MKYFKIVLFTIALAFAFSGQVGAAEQSGVKNAYEEPNPGTKSVGCSIDGLDHTCETADIQITDGSGQVGGFNYGDNDVFIKVYESYNPRSKWDAGGNSLLVASYTLHPGETLGSYQTLAPGTYWVEVTMDNSAKHTDARGYLAD